MRYCSSELNRVTSLKCKMEMNQQFLDFMNNFKTMIEKSVNTIGVTLNNQLEEKLSKIELQVKDLKEQADQSDAKQEQVNKNMEQRLKRIEQDAQREKYRRMKSDTLGVQPVGRINEAEETIEDRNVIDVEKLSNLETDVDDTSAVMTKQRSWYDECEEHKRMQEDHKVKKCTLRSGNSTPEICWTEGLKAQTQTSQEC